MQSKNAISALTVKELYRRFSSWKWWLCNRNVLIVHGNESSFVQRLGCDYDEPFQISRSNENFFLRPASPKKLSKNKGKTCAGVSFDASNDVYGTTKRDARRHSTTRSKFPEDCANFNWHPRTRSTPLSRKRFFSFRNIVVSNSRPWKRGRSLECIVLCGRR